MVHSHAHQGVFHRPAQLSGLSWKAAGWWLTCAFFVGAAVVITMRFTEISKIIAQLAEMKPAWLAPALCFQALSYICAAGVYGLTIRQGRSKTRFMSLVLLSIGQVFARQAVPSGGVTGSLLVLKGLGNRHVPRDVAAACLVINMVSFYIGYAAAVAAAMAIYASQNALSHRLESVGMIVLAAAGATPLVLLRLWKAQARHQAPRIVQRWDWSRRLYQTVRRARSRMRGSKLVLLEAAVLQLGVFVADAATLFVVLLAFGPAPPVAFVFAAHVMANAIGTVAPVPLGLGAYEGACIFLLHRAGATIETALATVLIFRGLSFWLPMLPGFFIARRELARRTRPH